MIEAVLFDYGGVLTPAGEAGSNLRRLGEFLDYRIEELEEAWHEVYPRLNKGHIDEEGFWAHLGRRLGQAMPQERSRYWRWTDFEHHSPEITTLVDGLRRRGIMTGILSNVLTPIAAYLKERGGYEGFDPVVLSCEVGYMKPEREIYELALLRVGRPGSQVLFIDDREANLEPARELGMATVLARDPNQIGREVRDAIGLAP